MRSLQKSRKGDIVLAAETAKPLEPFFFFLLAACLLMQLNWQKSEDLLAASWMAVQCHTVDRSRRTVAVNGRTVERWRFECPDNAFWVWAERTINCTVSGGGRSWAEFDRISIVWALSALSLFRIHLLRHAAWIKQPDECSGWIRDEYRLITERIRRIEWFYFDINWFRCGGENTVYRSSHRHAPDTHQHLYR